MAVLSKRFNQHSQTNAHSGQIRPQLTVAQPSEVRNSQPSRVEVPNTGNPDGTDLEQRLCPPSRRSRQCEDVDESETLLVQAEEERGPEEVETKLGVVEFERTDGDLAREELDRPRVSLRV